MITVAEILIARLSFPLIKKSRMRIFLLRHDECFHQPRTDGVKKWDLLFSIPAITTIIKHISCGNNDSNDSNIYFYTIEHFKF